MKLNITEQMHIHSLNGALAGATIVEKVGNNKYIAEFDGKKCTAIYNPFVSISCTPTIKTQSHIPL